MVFNMNTIIDIITKMTGVKHVLHATIETNTNFKSIKTKKLQLFRCSSPKKHETVLTCQIMDKLASDDDIKRVDKELHFMFYKELINYIMSDDFKNLTNGSNI